MANLTAVFELVDRISDRLDAIANRGSVVVDSLENAGDTIDQTFDGAISAADGAVSAVGSYSQAIGEAATQTDFWTDAVGNYDKSALEAIYTTEELVEQGLKTAEALEHEADIMEMCDRAAQELSQALDATSQIQEDCSAAMEKANKIAEEVAENDKVSAEAKENLQRATEEATAAFEELEAAQQAAQSAMDEYNALLESGTASLDEMQNAASNAAQANDRLVQANERASNATEELSDATQEAADEAENGGKSGITAIEGVASALAAAGITATLKEIAEAAYGLADAYSESSKIIVNATGATGDALDGLGQSMLEAYSGNDDSLEDTAAAVGELNTRLGLTGDELTEVTGKFMDFGDVTNGNAAKSVRSVTQLMSQWNVPADEMYLLLDKLTYAGQASGISVDTLTSQLTSNKAILDQLGFSLDEATAMFMQFELAGTNSTAVMTGFRTALSSGAISSLEELYEVFGDISSGAMTAADASEMFGSRAGPAIVDAVNSGVLSLDDMVAALENSEGVMDTTAEAGESLSEKWQKASNNIGTAFTTAVQPTLDGLSSGFAEIVNEIGTFLNEHPAVTKAITAIGIGVGVVVAGIAGVTFVTTVAIPAVTAFGVALNTALGPIGWVALAITGIVAAGTALVAMMNDTEDETANMTAVTQKQYYELQDLNAEYDRAVEKYGENSEEALRLQYQIDDLSEAFENNRQTLEEFQTEVDELCTSVNDLWTEFDAAIAEINASETGTLALIQKYEDLTEKASLTAGEQKQLEAVTKSLAEAFPDLSADIDDATLSAEEYVEAIKKAAEAEAQAQRQAEAEQAFIEATKKQLELEEEIAKARENLRLSQEADDNAAFLSDQWFYDKTGWLGMWATQTNEYQDALDELLAAEEENNAKLAELNQGFENLAKAEEEAANKALTYEEATDAAFDNVKDKVDELILAYDEAYQAAYDSFQGQFGLFDEAAADMEATVVNAQTAMDSQLAYWEAYAANIDVLKNTSAEDLGITQENYDLIMSQVQDGSEQAAGLAASMVEAINNGDEEAVALLAETAGKVAAKQEEIATATAEWQTNFDAQMQEIVKEMEGYVAEFGFEDEAAKAASDTMTSYAASIRAGKNEAVTAADEVAAAVERAISNVHPTITVSVQQSGTIPGHATGTTNAEDIFVAGEEGPELIVGKAGSTVFPHSETERIIAAVSEPDTEATVVNEYDTIDDRVFNYDYSTEIDRSVGDTIEQAPINNGMTERAESIFVPVGENRGIVEDMGAGKDESTRKILLEIAGKGNIELSGGKPDKEGLLAFLYEYLKPVLSEILTQEIYEEGDLSYEY